MNWCNPDALNVTKPLNFLNSQNGSSTKAGIEDFRFHDLRHTFGSRLAQAGVDINTIARLIGHKDLKMTQRYIHHTVDSLRVGVDRLENFGYNSDTIGKISESVLELTH